MWANGIWNCIHNATAVRCVIIDIFFRRHFGAGRVPCAQKHAFCDEIISKLNMHETEVLKRESGRENILRSPARPKTSSNRRGKSESKSESESESESESDLDNCSAYRSNISQKYI